MSLIRSLAAAKIVKVTRVINTVHQRSASHWVPDYKPGPYPKTEEERVAAAKKYNLLPEEYEPYPDDGSGAGDYPKLPFESVDAKDPYYAYDQPILRRDFMEPVHRKVIILFPELLTTEKPPYDYTWGVLQSSIACLICAGFFWYIANTFKLNHPVLEKQYPYRGETHYLFARDLDKSK